MCKANYAAGVKPIMSQGCHGDDLNSYIKAIYETIAGRNYLDNSAGYGVFFVTCWLVRLGTRHETGSGNQSQDSRRRRGAQPPSGADSRSEVSRSGVLRPDRSGAGQIRNAAPRIGRWHFDNRCHDRVWGVTADLLSGQGQHGRGRHCRIGPEKTGATRSPQAQRRNHDIHRSAYRIGATDAGERPCTDSPRTFRSACPSTNHRARVAGKKNGATQERIADTPVVSDTTTTERYERLRRNATEDHFASEVHTTAALLCCCGLWRWLHTTEKSPETTTYRPDTTGAVASTDGSSIIVHLLAQIAVTTRDYRRTR